jgi:hypothetical protein
VNQRVMKNEANQRMMISEERSYLRESTNASGGNDA